MSKDLQTRLNNIIKSLPQKSISENELRSLLATNKRFSTERAIAEAIKYLKSKKIKITKNTSEEVINIKKSIEKTNKSKTVDDLLDEEFNDLDDAVEYTEDLNLEKDIEKVSLDSIPSAIVQYFNDVTATDTSRLTADQERELISKAQAGDMDARDEFINHNLLLAIKVAKYYYDQIDTTLALDDLIQEANIGLITALDKFDLSKNYRFSTYAMNWITCKIKRALASEGRTIKFPVYLVELLRHVKLAINQLEMEKATPPTDEEILEILEKKNVKIGGTIPININYVKDARKLLNRRMVSLHAPVGEEQDSELGDFIPSFDFSPNEELEREDLLNKVSQALPSVLNEKECYIIRKRYGMNPEQKCYTLKEIADEFGVKHQAIQQMEQRALVKLKRGSIGNMLKTYFEYHNYNEFDLTPGKKDALF